jgi:DNA polymerase III subunit gamma/tau
LSTFDQIVSYSGDKLTYKNVIDNLNVLDYEYFFRVTDCILDGDSPQLLLIFNEIIENGFDGQHFIVGLAEHLRNLLVLKDPATIELMLASASLKEKYKDQAARCDAVFLLSALELCNKYDLDYKASNNKRLHIEIALMLLCQKGTPTISAAEPSKNTVLPSPQPKRPAIAEKKVDKPTATSATSLTGPAPEKQEKLKEEKETYKNPVEEKKEVEVKTSIPATTRRTPEVKKGRLIKNISIKDSLNALRTKPSAEEEENEPVIISEFDQEKLEETWTSFVESYHGKSPSFSIAIGKHKPMLKENYVIEYKVDNILIAKDVLNVTALLQFLKKELNNNQLTLKHVLPKKGEQKTAYTDREKFEAMAKKYPGLIKLREQLNLELEF